MRSLKLELDAEVGGHYIRDGSECQDGPLRLDFYSALCAVASGTSIDGHELLRPKFPFSERLCNPDRSSLMRTPRYSL